MAPRFPRAWLAYAGLLTAATLWGEISNLVGDEPFSWLVLADWILTASLLTATWGYALQRPMGNAVYWRRVFWILVVASALMLLRVALSSTVAFVLVLILATALVPAYLAAFRYAYRSPQLWPR